MSKKLFFLTVLLLGVVNGVVLGYPDQNDYSIARSLPPTIDGIINPGEWEKAEWIEMTEVVPVGSYPAWPADLSNCWWAALWSPENNLIYVATYGTDTDHIFAGAMIDWNKHDDIEIYIDANESNTDSPMYYRDTFRYAQHYFMGPDGEGGGWVNMGRVAADHLLPGGYDVSVVGNLITYEFALTPYADLDMVAPETSVIKQLQLGEFVGLDIDFMSFYEDTYGRVSEHFSGAKWRDANSLLDLLLVNAIDTSVAHLESPWKYETGVLPESGLNWAPGDNADEHDVYFGTSFEDVNNAGKSDQEYITTLALESNSIARSVFHSAGELEMGTTYYWRVDEVNDACSPYFWKGNVWHFTVDSGKAQNPDPADNAPSVPWTGDGPTLIWTKGLKAATNDVYFGISFDDVNNAGKSDSEYIGNQTDCNIARADYYPGDFVMGKTYYWRIDSINDLDDRSPWKGNVWSFTISDHLVLDDFESYGNDTELRAVWKDNSNQAAPKTWCYAFRSSDPAIGAQAMKLNCMTYFAPYYTEVRQTFASDQDWSATSASGVKALSLMCHGTAANPDDYLYVWLKDSAGLRAVQRLSDPDIIKTETWTEINLALSDFTSPDAVDLSEIRTIAIGVGPEPGAPEGSGALSLPIYIDDVRLYIPRCVPGLGGAGDVTGDCVTNFKDVKLMSRDWGTTTWDVTVIAPVNDPCLWYKFDSDPCDASGNGYNATVVDGAIEYGLDRNDQLNKALMFDGTETHVDVPVDVFTDIADVNEEANEITVSLWHYGEPGTANTHRHVFFAENPADHPEDPNNTWDWRNLNLYFQNNNSTVHVAMGNDGNPAVDAITKLPESEDVYEGRWNHWAVTKDCHAGELKVYLNGALWNWNTSPATIPIANIGVFRIGAETGREDDPPYNLRGYLTGKIDDFRIYDYALSQGEVCSLADMTIGSTYTQPMQLLLKSDANIDIYEDGTINFKDHAVLANTWLEEKMWP